MTDFRFDVRLTDIAHRAYAFYPMDLLLQAPTALLCEQLDHSQLCYLRLKTRPNATLAK